MTMVNPKAKYPTWQKYYLYGELSYELTNYEFLEDMASHSFELYDDFGKIGSFLIEETNWDLHVHVSE